MNIFYQRVIIPKHRFYSTFRTQTIKHLERHFVFAIDYNPMIIDIYNCELLPPIQFGDRIKGENTFKMMLSPGVTIYKLYKLLVIHLAATSRIVAELNFAVLVK